MERRSGRWWTALAGIAVVAGGGWWALQGTDGPVPEEPAPVPSSNTVSTVDAAAPSPTTISGPEGPFIDVDPEPTATGVAVTMPAGTLHFEIVGHAVATVFALPDVKAPDGTYARIQWEGASGVVQVSANGLDWTPLTATDGMDNPMLAVSPSGVLVVSYRSSGGESHVEEWAFWRHDGDAWRRLGGLPSDAGSPVGSATFSLASGRELLVTASRGPLADLATEIQECPSVAGVATDEPWPSVVLATGCGPSPGVVGTLGLLGDGDSSLAILRDPEGGEWWRSESGLHVEAAFGRLYDLALVTGPETRVIPDIFLWGGGIERSWTSADGWTFELASTRSPWPYPIAPAVVDGTVFVLVPDLTLVESLGDWRIDEASTMRVMRSADGATWTDEAVDVVLEEGGDLWDISLAASTDEVVVQLPGPDLVRSADGMWREVDVPESLAPLQAMGRTWVALEFVLGIDSGPQFAVSSDLERWHRFAIGDVSELLGCGPRPSEMRVIGGELWISGWNGDEVCIIRGVIDPAAGR